MEKIKKILSNTKCLKLICGAGNENLKEIEKLAYVYAKAGFNMIDLCAKADVLAAAKKGIERAGMQDEMLICISIGMQDDIHFMKAVINRLECTLCKNCINICPQNAIYIEDEKVHIDEKRCIGCGKCINVCKCNAIFKEHKYKTPYSMLLPLISEGIDCIEFHCSSENESSIIDEWNKIKSVYNGCLGACFDRSKLGDDKLIDLIEKMNKDTEFFIFQADGKPMSGGNDDYKSTLQTVAFAQLIRAANLPVYLILSGGTNSKTSKLAKECDVPIDGIALGSYARKLVKEEITSDNFFENIELCETAINKAKNLAENLLLYKSCPAIN